MSADCIFCKIVAGEIPADIRYQDDEVIAFPDINPAAPVHLLIIPKQHIPSLAHINEGDTALIGRMVGVANRLAREAGIADEGYRLLVNCGEKGGQLVPHLHMHLLGGGRLESAP
jgi:histidine triad (HIT) family protein